MSEKALTVSLVIPAFNEQEYLKDCLKSIEAQTIPFEKVYVVNNNSTDKTVEIAESFNFVTVINESQQGILYGRDAGFNTVTSDIIARIDADSRLPAIWVEGVISYMTEHPQAVAVSSENDFYDIALPGVVGWFHRAVYFWTQRAVLGAGVLWGSNMAIRTSAWHKVNKLHVSAKAHEDLDLMVKLKRKGLRVDYVEKLRGTVSFRRGKLEVIGSALYLLGVPRTYWQNGYRIRGTIFGTVLGFCYLIGLPILLLRALFSR